MHNISEQSGQCLGRTNKALGWFSRIRGLTRVLAVILFLALLHNPVQGMESITLMWDACTDTNVAGYVIYHGPVGSGITNSTVLDTSTTTATVSNLTAGLTYFFFVTAYDAQFLESDPSNVIFDTPLATSGTSTTGASNAPPHLAPIAGQSVMAGETLSFSATATDMDVPAQSLTFSLAAGAPAGAGIDPMSGWFTWTPSLAQGGSSTSVTIFVTDNGSPALSDAQTVAIAVGMVALPPNTTPHLATIGKKSVIAGTLLAFAVSATDTDSPGQTLTFSLAAGAPAGASIDPMTGAFAWTPALALGDTTNFVTFRVTASGSPALSAAQTIAIITVVPTAPVAAALQIHTDQDGQLVLSGTGQPGSTYEIQATVNLTTWTVVGTVTAGTDGAISFVDADAPSHTARYYRWRAIQ